MKTLFSLLEWKHKLFRTTRMCGVDDTLPPISLPLCIVTCNYCTVYFYFLSNLKSNSVSYFAIQWLHFRLQCPLTRPPLPQWTSVACTYTPWDPLLHWFIWECDQSPFLENVQWGGWMVHTRPHLQFTGSRTLDVDVLCSMSRETTLPFLYCANVHFY